MILLQKIYSVLGLLDEIILIKLLNLSQCFSFHKVLDFPLKKIVFLSMQEYHLDLKNPVTLNEKIVYRQLFQRNSFLPETIDKYVVQKYVREKYLAPLLQTIDSFDLVQFPDKYIIKITHGSEIYFCELTHIVMTMCKILSSQLQRKRNMAINGKIISNFSKRHNIC